MLGKTHFVGGAVGSLAGYMYLKNTGGLLPETVLNPTLQLIVIYSAGLYGGRLSDVDHHLESSPLQDPASVVLNKILHIFNPHYRVLDKTLNGSQKKNSVAYKWLKFLSCRHRSWQTHSEFTLGILWILYNLPLFTADFFTGYIDLTLLRLIVTGLSLGVVSHIFLDLLTTDGVPFATGQFIKTFSPKAPVVTRLRLVPKSPVFATDTAYETNVRKLLKVIQYVLLAFVVADLLGYDLWNAIINYGNSLADVLNQR